MKYSIMETKLGIIYRSNEWKYQQELTSHTENRIESLESYIFTLNVEFSATKFTVNNFVVSQKGSAILMLSLENNFFLSEHWVKMLGEV